MATFISFPKRGKEKVPSSPSLILTKDGLVTLVSLLLYGNVFRCVEAPPVQTCQQN